MRILLGFVFLVIPLFSISQTKTIHVFVALCDNEFQGIVPVPEAIGNGKDAAHNLYWGAGYGVKNYFDKKSPDWILLGKSETNNPLIIQRLLFKHSTKDIYLLADAYDGEFIFDCIEDFLKASNQQLNRKVVYKNKELDFGGKADLLAYVGHDGLMEFVADVNYKETKAEAKPVIVLACDSRYYFSRDLQKANAKPLLLTTNLMAPEAYTLKAAIDGWINNESSQQIKERAAQAYNKYQKCGIRGARNLFSFSFQKTY